MSTRHTAAIRFESELHERLVAAAEERRMSLNALVCAMCDHGLALLNPPQGLFRTVAEPPDLTP